MWTSVEVNRDAAVALNLNEYSGSEGFDEARNIELTNGTRKEMLFSIRCLKVSTIHPNEMVMDRCPLD